MQSQRIPKNFKESQRISKNPTLQLCYFRANAIRLVTFHILRKKETRERRDNSLYDPSRRASLVRKCQSLKVYWCCTRRLQLSAVSIATTLTANGEQVLTQHADKPSLKQGDIPFPVSVMYLLFISNRALSTLAMHANCQIFFDPKWLHCDQAFRQVHLVVL